MLKKDGPGAVALLKPLLAKHPQGMDLEVRRSLAEAELLAGQPAEAVKLIDGQDGRRTPRWRCSSPAPSTRPATPPPPPPP